MQEISYLHRCALRGAWIEIYIAQVNCPPRPNTTKGKPEGRGFLTQRYKKQRETDLLSSLSPSKKGENVGNRGKMCRETAFRFL